MKKRLLDCPNEPPVRIELTTSFYLYGALPPSLGGIKFAGYDFQRKYYVLTAWICVQFVRLQVGCYLRNLLTRFTSAPACRQPVGTGSVSLKSSSSEIVIGSVMIGLCCIGLVVCR